MKFKLLLLSSLFILGACGEDSSPVTNKDFEGVFFDNVTVTYDGESHILDEVKGAPQNTIITYTGRYSQSEAGVYEAIAVLSKEGYNDKTLKATLTIEAINFTGITFEDYETVYDGQVHEIKCSNVPSFASVVYTNHSGTDAGLYKAKAVITAPNYNPLTLEATMNIKNGTISGVIFEDLTVKYDGEPHKIECSNLPFGVSAIYENNVATEVGIYNTVVYITGPNYNPLVLYAILTIEA